MADVRPLLVAVRLQVECECSAVQSHGADTRGCPRGAAAGEHTPAQSRPSWAWPVTAAQVGLQGLRRCVRTRLTAGLRPTINTAQGLGQDTSGVPRGGAACGLAVS